MLKHRATRFFIYDVSFVLARNKKEVLDIVSSTSKYYLLELISGVA